MEREDERIPIRTERDGDEDEQGQRERRTVWHKAQVRILFSCRERGKREEEEEEEEEEDEEEEETVPRWVKYSGPVPSKGAGLSPP